MKSALAWLLVGLTFFASGCVLRVIDKDGIDACLNDVAESEIKTLRLKRRLSPESPEYKKLSERYDDVAISVRKFLNRIHSDASTTSKVDVSVAAYQSHPSGKEMTAFLEDVRKQSLGVVETADPVTGKLVESFIAGVVVGIGELHQKAKDAALKRLQTLLRRGEMASFEGLSDASLERKYMAAD